MNPMVLQNGAVVVTNVNPATKTFSIAVKVHCSPLQLHTPFIQKMIACRVAKAVDYLQWEGLVEGNVDTWKCEIAAVAYQK